MVGHACSLSYLEGWWGESLKPGVGVYSKLWSYDHTSALQFGQQSETLSLKKEEEEESYRVLALSLSMGMHQGKARWEHSEKAAVSKPRQEPSPETEFASTSIMQLAPQLWKYIPVLRRKVYSLGFRRLWTLCSIIEGIMWRAKCVCGKEKGKTFDRAPGLNAHRCASDFLYQTWYTTFFHSPTSFGWEWII